MPSIANYFFATFYSTYFFPVTNKYETSGILVSLPRTTRNSVRINYTIQLKGKVFPYSLPSVGPGADPGVQAVSPQVT